MRVWAGMLIVLVAVTAAAAQSLTVKGDAKAWQEIMASWERVARAKTYRARMTWPGRPMTGTMEYVYPDRFRTVTQTGQGRTVEVVMVGKELRLRLTSPDMPAGWQCNVPLADGPECAGAGLWEAGR